MHFLYKPEMLPFDFLDPERDKVLDFCLRNLLWSDPEKLRAFMGPDPMQSPYFSEFGESGFECRLSSSDPEVRQLFRDWPRWAKYKVTAYDFFGQDRVIRYYRALDFESHIRGALRTYLHSFPDRHNAITALAIDIGLGEL
jgi:hypothetical protein